MVVRRSPQREAGAKREAELVTETGKRAVISSVDVMH